MLLHILCVFLLELAVPASAHSRATALEELGWQRGSPSALVQEPPSSAASEELSGQTVIAGSKAGKPFSKKQKKIIKEKNALENEGKNHCENCGTETVPGQKHEKGVTPPVNETQVDHKIPRIKGGSNEVDNGQVLCRDCNLKKGSKDP